MPGPDKDIKFPLENFERLVVTKDVEPYSIVGGNPAKEIRKRFPGSTIQRLLKLTWRDWDIEKITKNLQHLTNTNIDLPEQH